MDPIRQKRRDVVSYVSTLQRRALLSSCYAPSYYTSGTLWMTSQFVDSRLSFSRTSEGGICEAYLGVAGTSTL